MTAGVNPTTTTRPRAWFWAYGSRIGGVSAAAAIAQVLMGALYVLGARALGPESFGHVAAMLAATTVMAGVFDFGLNSYLIREIAAGRLNVQTAAALVASKRVLVPVLMVAITAVGFVMYRDPLIAPLFGLVAWALWESQTVSSSLRAKQRFRAMAIAQVTGRGLGLAVGGPMLAVDPLLGILIGSILSYVGEFVICLAVGRFVARPAHLRALWQAQRTAGGYGFAGLALSAQQLDTPLVALSGGAHAAGLYAAASRLISPLTLLSSMMGNVVAPGLASAGNNSAGLRAMERRVLLIAGLLATGPLLAAGLGPVMLPALFGAAFRESGHVFVVLALGAAIVTFNQAASSIVQNRGGQVLVATIYASGTALGLSVIFFAALTEGAIWAAWGFVTSQMFMAIGLGWKLYKVDTSPPEHNIAEIR